MVATDWQDVDIPPLPIGTLSIWIDIQPHIFLNLDINNFS